MRSKFENTDEWYAKEAERIKRAADALRREEAIDSIFHTGDSIASIDNPATPDEELERLAWELNVAEINYWAALFKRDNCYNQIAREGIIAKGIVQYRQTLKELADYDSGVSEVDPSPGSELNDYANKHGQ